MRSRRGVDATTHLAPHHNIFRLHIHKAINFVIQWVIYTPWVVRWLRKGRGVCFPFSAPHSWPPVRRCITPFKITGAQDKTFDAGFRWCEWCVNHGRTKWEILNIEFWKCPSRRDEWPFKSFIAPVPFPSLFVPTRSCGQLCIYHSRAYIFADGVDQLVRGIDFQ